jgi:hypothetical protein
VVLVLSGLPTPAAVAQRLGNEFQANTYTNDQQQFPSVAAAASGDFVIVWESNLQDGYLDGVFGRRFSSAGAALAVEFQVNTFTNGSVRFPSVGVGGSGDFLVAWGSSVQDGDGEGVFAKRYSSTGTVLASEFQVNTHTTAAQFLPRITPTGAGNFVIVWGSTDQDGSEFGVFARRFASGGAVAAEFQVNTHTGDDQSNPVAAASASGDFVVVWHSRGQDGDNYGVFAQRFSSTGAALASEFQVNAYTTHSQSYPAVAAAASGDFVVAWHGYNQDGDNNGIFARRFSSAGAALASEFQVNTHTDGAQQFPMTAAGTDGDFVITWESLNQDSSDFGIFARSFSSAGAPLATEFQVNSYTSLGQRYPQVGAATSGNFVVAWQSNFQDGDDNGIFAQRFASPKLIDIDGDGAVLALTDGLLLLRFTFSFTGAVLTNNAVNLTGCTRCDPASIEAYLKTLN